ncbi:MAG TPA: DNA recombination protein RmuC, partial [Dehalococcoidia bacterium]|nr:DNA recombination protein RmuC [Dehalococcoidia bacterium]
MEKAAQVLAGLVAAPFLFLIAVWRAFLDMLLQRREREADALLLLHQSLAAMQVNMQESMGRVQQTLQSQVNSLDERLSQRLNNMQSSMNEAVGGTVATMKKVGEDLGELKGAAQRMVEEGQKVSGLIEILGRPTFRGGFGEFLLDRLLGQVLPAGSYEMPYAFKNGLRVDAAVFLGERIVPIDAKFPLEGFQRLTAAGSEEERKRLRREFLATVRGHMEAITKYIVPDEGTFDFALMYIPAENVYYEVILREEIAGGESLADYALQRRIVPVSPNSFYL